MYYFKNETCYISIIEEITDELAADIVSVIHTANYDDKITDIEVSINSAGGNVMGGFSIYSELIRSPKKVTTINSGCALSIASIIFLAGQIRKAHDYSLLMIHNPYSEAPIESKVLSLIKSSLITILGKDFTEDNLDELMSDESWFTAEQLKNMKIVQEIIISGIKLPPIEQNVENIYSIVNQYIKNQTQEMEVKNMVETDEKEVKNEVIPVEEVTTEEPSTDEMTELKTLIEELKTLVTTLKTENEAYKMKLEETEMLNSKTIENNKIEVLNSAGVKVSDSWMKLEIEQIKELLNSMNVKKSPLISNEKVEVSLKNMSDEDFQNLAKNNPSKLVELYKLENNKIK